MPLFHGQLENPPSDSGSLKLALSLYFALLGVSFLVVMTSAFSSAPLGVRAQFGASILMASVILFWCGLSRRTIVPSLLVNFPWYWLPIGVGLGILTNLLASSVVWGLHSLGLASSNITAAFADEGYGVGWVILMVCVMPALFEELAFRGVIQSALRRTLGTRDAIIVMALMFAILHLSIPSIPHLAILGLVLGWLRYKTQSLYPGMLLHFTHNFLVVLAESQRMHH